MARYVKGKDGKFTGSVGDGKDHVPVPGDLPTPLADVNGTVDEPEPDTGTLFEQFRAWTQAASMDTLRNVLLHKKKWGVREPAIDQDDVDTMRTLLMGRRVVSADKDLQQIVLDNGVQLEVVPNEGCGGCTAGWYHVADMNVHDNVITRVDMHVEATNDYADAHRYTIFVYSGHEQINLLTVEGTDGNGYYGYGFNLVVRLPE